MPHTENVHKFVELRILLCLPCQSSRHSLHMHACHHTFYGAWQETSKWIAKEIYAQLVAAGCESSSTEDDFDEEDELDDEDELGDEDDFELDEESEDKPLNSPEKTHGHAA